MVRQFKSIEEVKDYILDLQSNRSELYGEDIRVNIMVGNGDKNNTKM
jgi:hypothetical protein